MTRHLPKLKYNLFILDSVKCYSCMSKIYAEDIIWRRLRNVFSRPMNFTDSCNRGQDQTGVGLIDCPSICLEFYEDIDIAGKKGMVFFFGVIFEPILKVCKKRHLTHRKSEGSLKTSLFLSAPVACFAYFR